MHDLSIDDIIAIRKRYNTIWYVSLLIILVVIGLAIWYYIDKNAKGDTDDKIWVIFVLVIGALAVIVFGWSWYKWKKCTDVGEMYVPDFYNDNDAEIE